MADREKNLERPKPMTRQECDAFYDRKIPLENDDGINKGINQKFMVRLALLSKFPKGRLFSDCISGLTSVTFMTNNSLVASPFSFLVVLIERLHSVEFLLCSIGGERQG